MTRVKYVYDSDGFKGKRVYYIFCFPEEPYVLLDYLISVTPKGLLLETQMP